MSQLVSAMGTEANYESAFQSVTLVTGKMYPRSANPSVS